MGVRRWSDPYRVDDLGSGERRVLAFDDELMLVHYTFEQGAKTALHDHEETTQSVYVLDGKVRFLGDYDATLEQGDTVIVPPGTTHGIEALERTELIDSFTPPIERYGSEHYDAEGDSLDVRGGE